MFNKSTRRRAARTRINRAVNNAIHPVEPLERRTMLSASLDLSRLDPGLDAALPQISNDIQPILNAQSLPLVGNQLGPQITTIAVLKAEIDKALGSITSTSQISDVITALQTTLQADFGSTPNVTEASITFAPQSGTIPQSGDEFMVSQTVTLTAANASSLSFSLGLPALNVSGGIALTVIPNFAYNLAFGAVYNTSNQATTFVIDTANTNFSFLPQITIPQGSSWTAGSFGPLAMTAQDYTGQQFIGQSSTPPAISSTNFNVSYVATFTNTVATFLTAANLSQLVPDVTLSGTAHLALDANLAGTGTAAAYLPTLQTVFTVDWDTSTAAGPTDITTPVSLTTLGDNVPEIGLNDLSIDLGKALSGPIATVINDIDQVLEPIKSIIQFLDGPMPLFNDVGVLKDVISDAIGGLSGSNGVLTVIDFFGFIAKLFGGADVSNEVITVKSFVNSIQTIYNIEGVINQLNALSSSYLSLGSFQLGGMNDSVNYDFRVPNQIVGPDFSNISNQNVSAGAISGSLNNYSQGLTSAIGMINSLFAGTSSMTPDVGSFSAGGTSYNFQTSSNIVGLHLPILQNPATALGLLFGQTVDFFTFTTPPMYFGIPFALNIPILGPLVISLRGNLNDDNDAALFGGQFSMGFDSYFITTPGANPIDGFYIKESDTFIGASFGIAADAALDLILIEAGVGGGIDANVVISLNTDGVENGELRETQINTDEQDGPLGMFEASGDLTASLNAFIEIGFPPFDWEDQVNFCTITLLDFNTQSAQPSIATLSDGALTLNLSSSTADSSGLDQGVDVFDITDRGPTTGGGQTLEVSAGGQSAEYEGVYVISGQAVYDSGGFGQPYSINIGPDVSAAVVISGVDPDGLDDGVSSALPNTGQEINDQGSGPATISLGNGSLQENVINSVLLDAPPLFPAASATVLGCSGFGDATIEADGALLEGAEDRLIGGDDSTPGAATLIAGSGNDYLQLGEAGGVMYDGPGNNTLVGGDGPAKIYVNLANDPNDTITTEPNSEPDSQNNLIVDGTGAGDIMSANYQNGELNVTSTDAKGTQTIQAANINTLDIEPAPGVLPSSLAAEYNSGSGTEASDLPTPSSTASVVNISLPALAGSGLTQLEINVAGSSTLQLANAVYVNITGNPNDTISIVGAGGQYTDPSNQFANANTFYVINSSSSLMQIATPDGGQVNANGDIVTNSTGDTLDYNLGSGSNMVTFSNAVETGSVVINSDEGNTGINTFNVSGNSDAPLTINQFGANTIVNVTVPVPPDGYASFVPDLTIGGALINSSAGNSYTYLGMVYLTLSDAQYAENVQITSGLLSGPNGYYQAGSLEDNITEGGGDPPPLLDAINWTFLTGLSALADGNITAAYTDSSTAESIPAVVSPPSIVLQLGPGGFDLTASGAPMTLLGGSGPDAIFADNQGDYIDGLGGDDTITVGNPPFGFVPGSETSLVATLVATGPQMSYVEGPTDTIIGGAGNNTIYDWGANGVIFGNDTTNDGVVGNNIINGWANGTIYTGQGENQVVWIEGVGQQVTINAGSGGDAISTGFGTDVIDVPSGIANIYAGPGPETIYGGGIDDVYGPDWQENFNFPFTTGTYNVQLVGNGDDSVQLGSGNDTVNVGGGQDTITMGIDVIRSGGGQDTLSVADGTESITAGGGNDLISAGAGTDSISVGGGNDSITVTTLSTGSGDDTITALNGNDYIATNPNGNGVESITAGGGQDTVIFGNGRVTVFLTDGPDNVTGGSGDDSVTVGNGKDIVYLTNGEDTIFAGNGNDSITAGNGGDQISTGSGMNTITTGSGNDIINIGSNANLVNAGGGFNTLIQDTDLNQVLTSNSLAALATTTFSNISNVSLVGQTSNHTFDVSGWTNAGAVELTGGTGNNTVISTDDDNYTLNNSSMMRSDGTAFSLVDIQNALLTGGNSSNTFDVSSWNGTATINGGGGLGVDTVIATDNTNITLSNTSLIRPGFGLITLINIVRAVLTGDLGGLTLDATAFTGQATLRAGASSDTLRAGTGGDALSASPGGLDVLVSSTGRDVIDASNSNGNLINAGTGGDIVYSTSSTNGITGTPAELNPSISSGVTQFSVPANTLPTGGDESGPWAQYSGSASAGGLSSSTGGAIDPVTVASASGQYVAWADDRTGTYQIYVAEHVNGAWVELDGSAHGGGISNSAGNSVQPSITLDGNGNPLVAWTEFNSAGTSSDIYEADYSAGGNTWVGSGNSLDAGGLSNTGAATDPKIVEIAGTGMLVTWLDNSSGISNIYAATSSGGPWRVAGVNGSSGANVTGSATAVTQQALAEYDGFVYLVWTQPLTRGTALYLLSYNGVWSAAYGSNTSTGVSGPAVDQPTIAIDSNVGTVIAGVSTANDTIVAFTVQNAAWAPVAITTSVTGTDPLNADYDSDPQLASADGTTLLTWTQTAPAAALAGGGFDTEIAATQLTGGVFTNQFPGDNEFGGINQAFSSATEIATAVDPSGHAFAAWDDLSSGSSQIYFRGNAGFTVHNIYYVGSNDLGADEFTTAVGASTNTGLSPSSPIDTISDLMTKYSLVPGDVIMVDSGTYNAGLFIDEIYNGLTIISPGGAAAHFTQPAIVEASATGETLDNLDFDAGITFEYSAYNDDLRNGTAAGITVGYTANVRIEQNVITGTGISLGSQASTPYIVGNTISSIAVTGLGATGIYAVDNTITAGIVLAGSTQSGTITDNNITALGTALSISVAGFTGQIDYNEIHGANVGVNYNASGPLNANQIFGNTTGIVASVNSSSGGLGFVGTSIPNNIFDNTADGVYLTGLMQNQHIYSNPVGVAGTGTLGGASVAEANIIETNAVGANFAGTIQFNQFDRNTQTISVSSGQLIDHNVIFNTAGDGLDVSGVTGVSIINNTFYSISGDNVLLENSSSNIELLDNIMEATGGYDLYVSNNSRVGFFSDYNDLYTIGTGKIVHWLTDFTDILSWQNALGLYDLHSIGSASINPAEGNPDLFAPVNGDLRILPFVNGIRSTSPATGTADPALDIGLPSSYQNLLTNPSFETGTTGWTVNVNGTTSSGTPTAFDGTSYFYAGAVASGFADQTVNLSSYASQIDGQTLALEFGGRIRSGVETISSQGEIVLTFLNSSGGVIGSAITLGASNVNNRWELVSARVNIPIGARSLQYQFESTRETGTLDDSYLDNAFIYVTPTTTSPDMGANGYSATDVSQVKTTHLHLITPDLYANWVLNIQHTITWASYGNSTGAPIKIDLYQNGTFLMTITSSTPDTGGYSWIPASSGLSYGMYGLQIEISLVGNSAVYDRSTETFTVPENGSNYYVNDGSTTGDQYSTAAGNDRATGKIPGAPLPSLTTLLREYSLGGGSTVYVDNGSYNDFAPVELSSNPALGTASGITIIGPTAAGDSATITADGFTGPAVIDVTDASNVTISHIALDGANYGVWVRNGSSGFTASYLTVNGNLTGGLRIESDSLASVSLNYITATNNTGDGIYLGGAFSGITNSTSSNNTGDGFDLPDAGAAVLTGDTATGDSVGLNITDYVSNTVSTVGSANLSAGLGNYFYGNGLDGIDATGQVLVAGNVVYGNVNGIGIALNGTMTATENVVYGNKTGIQAESTGVSITYNTVYGNTGVGVEADDGAVVTGNTAYSNSVGIKSLTSGNTLSLVNNLVYGNSTQGIWIVGGGSGAAIDNNTVYQSAGDALLLDAPGGTNIHLDDNIFWTSGGYDIAVNAASESGFVSNYNDLFVTGSGLIGIFGSTSAATFSAWQSASGGDSHSISTNPEFVNAAAFDFHPQSSTGSFEGGTLSPVLSNGIPTANPGSLTVNVNQSPTIDAGDPSAPFSAELLPNGNVVNLGSYGDTLQASKSLSSYVVVQQPSGGVLLEGRSLTITWQSQDTSGTVNIVLLQNGSSTPVLTIASGVPNSGSYAWAVPTTITPGANFTIAVTRNAAPVSSGISASFSLHAPVSTFYVNGTAAPESGTFAGGTFALAAGNDANTGLDAADAKATLQALLSAYPLQSGDIIYVDGGTYSLSSNLVLTAADSGITIEGVTSGATVFSRSGFNTGSYVFDLQGAASLTLLNLSVTGGQYGINASTSQAIAGLIINGCTIYGDAQAGINLSGGNGAVTIENNSIHDMTGGNGATGIAIVNDDATITGNTIYNMQSGDGVEITTGDNSTVSGNHLYNDGTGVLANDTTTITGNIAYSDGSGFYGGTATLISGNTAYNSSTGIGLSGGTATGNVSYNNSNGIYFYGTGTASNNLLYNNSAVGIFAPNGAILVGNVIYGDGWGISLSSAPNTATPGQIVENNLIYNNTAGGIELVGGNSPTFLNNTIYQTAGVGFAISAYGNGLLSHNIAFRDNIIWDTAGGDITVDTTDQTDLASDYNDLYYTGTGSIGVFGSGSSATLATWQAASGQDEDSISANPEFVNIASGDFHPQSSNRSYHGGTLAPILNTTTGLPQANPGVPTIDANTSLTIDAGSAADPYASEPATNGGYVNLGSYGNSSQASISPPHFLTVLRPTLGQSAAIGSAISIVWRDEVANTSAGASDTVDFAAYISGNSTAVQTFTGPDTGSYNWTPPSTLSPGSYTIQITRTDGTGLVASSSAFTLSVASTIYYVATNGSDSNNGRSPTTAKATIAGLLNAGYTFNAGDTIEVGSGTFNISSNLALVAADSGIIITGASGGGTILNRGSTASGSYIFDLQSATNITFENLTFEGSYAAINAGYGNSSTGLNVSNCTFTGEFIAGVYLNGNNGAAIISGCTFSKFTNAQYGYGIYAYTNDTITATNNVVNGLGTGIYSQNTVAGNISNNTTYNNNTGIFVSGSGSTATVVNVNKSYDNQYDISLSGAVIATGNTVYQDSNVAPGLTNGNQVGIVVSTGATAIGNSVYGNVTGINVINSANVVSGNTVYNSSHVGISGAGGNTITGNIVFSNGTWGITGASTTTNNLVYNNGTGGIDINGGGSVLIANNTVYQTVGNAFELDGTPTASPNGITIQNNIFWVATTGSTVGYAMQIADTAAYGFSSDYNDLYATGNGQVAKMSTQAFTTVPQFAWELGQDVHSISVDPQFVSITNGNFNVSTTSPTIDLGNPSSAFNLEPTPNGGRINLGYTGDTAQATASASQLVQVLYPAGNLKLTDGDTYTITWSSTGLPAGTTATVSLSLDGGNTWTQLAANVALNSSGGGTLAWTPTASTTTATGLIRVTANGGTNPVGISPIPFSLTNVSTAFYVSATGNNANSGTSASAPMSSIEAVVNSYAPGAGDTIYVAGGTYNLFHDLVLGPVNDGLTICGPTTGTAAVLNRGSTSDYAFNLLTNTLNVTIEYLSITGANYGIFGTSGEGVNGITVVDDDIYSNYTYGVSAGYSTGWNVSGNVVHDNGNGASQGTGINLSSVTANILNNTVYNEPTDGIYFATPVYGTVLANNKVTGNTVYSNGNGIWAVQATISNNIVHDNATNGIYAQASTLNPIITGNTVYRQINGGIGISVNGGGTISNNIVFDNYNGIFEDNSFVTTLTGNRIYSNTDDGIILQADYGAGYSASDLAVASNNLIYANSIAAILMNSDSGVTLINNTIYQITGNGITLTGTPSASSPLTVENNIISVQNGYGIDVPNSPAGGVVSNYNLFNASTGSGVGVGFWNGSAGATLSTWQTLSGQDSHSANANPMFVDPAGADGTLGYNTSGAGYNDGLDDNFTLSAGSPAIDDGISTGAPTTDLLGEGRVDDPGTPNTGAGLSTYYDRGAFEFQGNSSNSSPPTVSATSPTAIGLSGSVPGVVTSITLTFSEPVNAVDATATGEYLLTNSTSTVFGLTPVYVIGSNQVVLNIAGGALPVGNYTFTLFGSVPNGLHDVSGNLLDGDADGTPGGNYIRSFSVTAAQAVSISSSLSYYLRLDANGDIDIWNSSADTEAYSEQLVVSQISTVTLTAAGTSAGTFIIDNSNGNVIPPAGLTLVGNGNTSVQIIGSGAGDSITANTGQVIFDGSTINYSQTTQTVLNLDGGVDALVVNSGVLQVAAPLAGSGLTVHQFSSITIGAGAKLQMLTPASHSDRALIITSTLTIAGTANAWTGTLDLGGNDLDVQSGLLATLINQIASGYNSGLWNGTGVQSSAAASDSTRTTALGVIQNNQGGTQVFGTGVGQLLFDGVVGTASDLLVKYTYYGDADLSGEVDGSDYSRIDNASLRSGTGWFNGDFNYDGIVNGSDYTLIDNAFNQQRGSLGGGSVLSYYLKLDADLKHIDIWSNATGTGAYAQQVLESQTTAFTLTANLGSGSFTIDNSAGKVFVTGGLSLVGDGSSSLNIIGTGGTDTVTSTSTQIVFDSNTIQYSGIYQVTLNGNLDLPANAFSISGSSVVQSSGTLFLLDAGNGSASQPAINMSSGATLRLIGTTNSASNPDIYFGPDSSGSSYYGSQILGGTLDLGSTQRFIEAGSGHNSVAEYLVPGYNVDSLITSRIIGSAGFNFLGLEEGSSGFYADLVLSAANTFTGPIEVNQGSVYLYPGSTASTTVLGGDNALTLNNSSGAGSSYSHFFLLGGNTAISNLSSIGSTPSNTAVANGNPDMGFAVGAVTLTTNQTANTTFGGTIADTVTDHYDAGSQVPGALSLVVTGSKSLTLTGGSNYSGATTVGINGSTPSLYLGTGGSLGDTPVTVNIGATFGAAPGTHLGDTSSSHSGGNLNINGGTLDMTAGGTAATTGNFSIVQPSSTTSNSLILKNATLDLDAKVSGADTIALTGPASVSGTNIVNITMLGTASSSPATYNLLTAPSGLTGTFDFANGTTTETIPYGTGTITLNLINAATSEQLVINSGTPAAMVASPTQTTAPSTVIASPAALIAGVETAVAAGSQSGKRAKSIFATRPATLNPSFSTFAVLIKTPAAGSQKPGLAPIALHSPFSQQQIGETWFDRVR